MNKSERSYSLDVQGQQELRTNLRRMGGDIVDFMRVSPQLHIPASIPIAFALDNIADFQCHIASGNTGAAVFNGLKGLIFVAYTGFIELKAHDNYQNYKQVRKIFRESGWDNRVAETMSHTLCDRNALRAAAIDAGYNQELQEHNGLKQVIEKM